MKPSISISIFMFLVASVAVAQTSAEIVVTASSIPETVEETPAAVSVITGEDIAARAARDVADVLREVPGLSASRTGTPGKAMSVFLRGGSSKQALVLWNGVEMNNPYFSGYDFGQLSTAGVQRVEVVRGPFSALYGSEAVSGVVNVLTVPAAASLRASLEGGERELLNANVFGALTRDRLAAHAIVEARADNGFEANDDFESRSVLGGARFDVTNAFSIAALARYATYDLGIPRTPNAESTAFVPSPFRRQEGSESQIAVPIRFDRGWDAYELRLSDSRRDEYFSDVAGPFGPEVNDTSSSLQAARATARFGTIAVGGEYELATVDHISNFSLIDARDRTNRSAFVENRFAIGGGIEIVAGLRHDDFETFGSEISPRVAAAWITRAGKLRAAYGEGFRGPAIGELYSPFFGNDALDAEHSRTIEVGYDRFAANGTASITVFRSRYDQLIVFGDDFRFQNIAAADAQGVEVSASRRAGNFRGAMSYTWLETQDRATGESLVRRPEHSGSISLGYAAGSFSTHVVMLHTGDRIDVTDLAPFGTVTNDAYMTADFVASYAVGAFVPFMKIENATNERYEEVFGYRSASRRISIGLRYTAR